MVTSNPFLPLIPSLPNVNLLYVDRIRIETGVAPATNITLHFRFPNPSYENPYSPHATAPPLPTHTHTHTKCAPFMYIKSLIPIALKSKSTPHTCKRQLCLGECILHIYNSERTKLPPELVTNSGLLYWEILNLCF